jgi:hypothetical protein
MERITMMQRSSRLRTVVVVLMLLASAGCSKLPVGTYVSQKNVNESLVLRSDRRYVLNEAGGTFDGKYRIEGHTITIETPEGRDLSQITIDGATLTDKDGDKWVRWSR